MVTLNIKIKILLILIIIAWIVSMVCYYYGNLDQTQNLEQGPILIRGYSEMSDPFTKPHVLNDVIAQDHCQSIMDYCRDKLFDSETVGGHNKAIRNSMQYWIPKTHFLARPIFEKMAEKFDIPFENGEDLQVVRYKPAQYYNEHHDPFCDSNEKCQEFVQRGGQRKLTIIIYLNDEFEGGYTYFPNLDLKLKAPPGGALIFYPLATGTSKCHPLALHAGTPVTKGEKWIANVWFREQKFI